MPIIKCVVCGTEKQRSAYEIERDGGKFCSHACANKVYKKGLCPHRPAKKGETRKCQWCKKPFYVTLPNIKKGNGKFCSIKCRGASKRGVPKPPVSAATRAKMSANHADFSGPNHPQWKGGNPGKDKIWRKENYTRLFRWRRAVIKRDGACKQCGSTNRLEAHHIVSLSETTDFAFLPMNGVTLCRTCHRRTDNYGARAKRQSKVVGTIYLKTIPQAFQCFTTLGTWAWVGDRLLVFVSEMDDWRYQIAVIMHELVEAVWCKSHGVTTEECDAFDAWYEEEYKAGRIPKSQEAGFDKRCPYYTGHFYGAQIERFIIILLKASWKAYLRDCDKVMGIRHEPVPRSKGRRQPKLFQ